MRRILVSLVQHEATSGYIKLCKNLYSIISFVRFILVQFITDFASDIRQIPDENWIETWTVRRTYLRLQLYGQMAKGTSHPELGVSLSMLELVQHY